MRTVIALIVALLTAGTALGQGSYTDHREPPDRPGVERIPAVIAAFNAGDAEAMQQCLREHFSGEFAEIPLAQHMRVWRDTLAQWGPVEFESVRTYDPPREDLVVIVSAPVIEGWRALTFTVGEDGRFTGMALNAARPPSYLPPATPLSVDEAAARIDSLVDRLAARDMFSGTVLIVQNGRPVLSKSVGLASRRFDVPNTMETKFNLGSMNKMFTAVAIAQLVENGDLSFDDTVGDILPDYPNVDVRNRVQIKHLLSHTSGMGSHFTDEFMESSKLLYRDFADYLPLFQDEPLAFDPGTDWSYSNAGFFVLGLLIEAASGQSYYDYVREQIYEPAGMADSDSYDMDLPIKNLAIGYTRNTFGETTGDDGNRWLESTGGFRNNYFLHSIKGGPAGGGFSTSPDLIRFATALTNGTLVSPATLEILTTPKPELSSPDYGFGFGVEQHGALGPVYGHSGGFPGINSILDIYPEQRLYVAVMANMDGVVNLVAGRFMQLIETGN